MRKSLNFLIKSFFILLSILATIKLSFFNLNVDEEYAIAMSYRMVTGDRMFLDMWDPHQTSGFLTAALIKIFLLLTDNLNYLVLYLRFSGALIHAGISIFLYNTLKKYFTATGAFIAAIFFYNTLPKWIQVPEFANMLVWFSTLAMLCLIRAYCSDKYQSFWFIAAGFSISGLVLAYPSCILSLPVLLLAMYKIRHRTFKKDVSFLLGTCVVLAICYVGYFLSHMSVREFLFGLRQMTIDGQHTDSLLQRGIIYGKELITLLPHTILCLGIAGIITLALKRFHRFKSVHPSWLLFSLFSIALCLIEQVFIWLGDMLNLHFPLLYFYFVFVFGAAARKRISSKSIGFYVLMWTGTIWGCAVWFSALLITNTTISVTGSYLMPGIIAGILFLSQAAKENIGSQLLPAFTALCLLGTTLFAKGYMICENEGLRSDIFFQRQKAIYSVSKNIYYRYWDGYNYNMYAELAENYISPEDTVLIVGNHSLYYLLKTPNISTYSLISTPTYDERLKDYWELFPERYPDIIVLDLGYCEMQENQELINELQENTLLFENETFAFYKTE